MVVNYTLDLHCNANTEDFLDIAYTWTHNGMDIRDTDVINNNRMVMKLVVTIIIFLIVRFVASRRWLFEYRQHEFRRCWRLSLYCQIGSRSGVFEDVRRHTRPAGSTGRSSSNKH